VTNYPEKGRSEDPKRHPRGPIKSEKQALSESANREATNHMKNEKNDL
jgi:hypothetical protein